MLGSPLVLATFLTLVPSNPGVLASLQFAQCWPSRLLVVPGVEPLETPLALSERLLGCRLSIGPHALACAPAVELCHVMNSASCF